MKILGLKNFALYDTTLYTISTQKPRLHEHQVPNPGFESGSQSTWERWSESGFESSLPPYKRNQSGSGSGSRMPV